MTISKFQSFPILAALIGCVAGLLIAGCDSRSETAAPAPTPSAPPAPVVQGVEVTFAYGSEKQKWVDDVTAAFNASGSKLPSGKIIHVTPVPMGSGECIDETLAGRINPHVLSPASAAFVTLGNARSRAATGRDLLASTQNLVLSPVVIAMWKPMADALQLANPGKQLGWADILSLATNPRGWAAYGHPEWGTFKFGHTHPEYSNSGLISVLAEVYAAAGKVRGLSSDDLANPAVGQFVEQIEHSVVHYGSSTGFFGRRMFGAGPQYLSAAVLYENMVIESYGGTEPAPLPVTAIYPREGTFWSDHPIGIVQREWVDDEHKAAAQAYIDFLLAEPQQKKALAWGFRPGDPRVALASPVDTAHGVDPAQPATTLEVPSAEVMDGVIRLWQAHKKHSSVTLVLDVSGSMNESRRLPGAKEGSNQFLSMLGDEDDVSLMAFSTNAYWVNRNVPMKTGRASLSLGVNGLIANGNTRLYDSIAEACQSQRTTSHSPTNGDRIRAVVVLTDGEDNASSRSLEKLLAELKPGENGEALRVFTIGYGAGANAKVLKRIADQTQAKFYEGTPENIRDVFKDIATFF